MIRKRDIEAFERLAERMDALLKRIQQYCPEANMYLEDSGNWNLMTSPSHDDNWGRATPRQDRVVTRVIVRSSGGGAW